MPMQVSGIRELSAKLGRIDADLAAELRPAVLEAGELVEHKAAANASFSSYIPGAGSTTASFSGSRGGAVVRFAEREFPHQGEVRVMEGDGVSPEPFRHPVYGGPGWAPGVTHPFLGPAVEEERPEAVALIAAAVHKALDI